MGKRQRAAAEVEASMLVFEDEDAGTVVMVGGPVTHDPRAVADVLESIAKELRLRPGLAKAGGAVAFRARGTG
jgi:hypothetical protein